MNRIRLWCGIGGFLALLCGSLRAEEPPRIPSPTDAPADWPHSQPALTEPDPPFLDPSSDCPPTPNESCFALYPPGMFGDLLAVEPVRPLASGGPLAATGPAAFRSSFKIAENESPRPLDRIFVTGNYYSDVDRSILASSGGSANVYREMLGFEKTFLGGDASVGVRLPYFQLTGGPGLAETRIGDVSLLFKYAFVNDRSTGNLASAGVVLTAPTGPSLPLAGQSSVNPTFVQPWIGGIWNWKDLYVQNFLSVAVPTDARDVSYFFKSVAVGYWLYRTQEANRLLTAIVPDAELHLNTPLNHRGSDSSPIGYPDTLDFTGGCYFFLRRAVLGVGVGAPLTGPKPYEYQVSTNLNFRY